MSPSNYDETVNFVESADFAIVEVLLSNVSNRPFYVVFTPYIKVISARSAFCATSIASYNVLFAVIRPC